MRDALRSEEELLAWALPQLGLRWRSFRRNKRQVIRRVSLRIRALGLRDARAYASYLEANASEWAQLEALSGVTISRFYRDQPVFDHLTAHVLPELAREGPARVWSAGCASGEEPYSIALAWELQIRPRFPEAELHVVATDRDAGLLARAAAGCYRHSSLRELPAGWMERGFTQTGDLWCLDAAFRRTVVFEQQDLRREAPDGELGLILCRNLAFSYFALDVQRAVLATFFARLRNGGALVIGRGETLPDHAHDLQPSADCEYVYRRGHFS
jgi:chemotaxis protein methyltransferase CheR